MFTGHQTPVAVLGKELAHDLALKDANAKIFYKQLPARWRDELRRRLHATLDA